MKIDGRGESRMRRTASRRKVILQTCCAGLRRTRWNASATSRFGLGHPSFTCVLLIYFPLLNTFAHFSLRPGAVLPCRRIFVALYRTAPGIRRQISEPYISHRSLPVTMVVEVPPDLAGQSSLYAHTDPLIRRYAALMVPIRQTGRV